MKVLEPEPGVRAAFEGNGVSMSWEYFRFHGQAPLGLSERECEYVRDCTGEEENFLSRSLANGEIHGVPCFIRGTTYVIGTL